MESMQEVVSASNIHAGGFAWSDHCKRIYMREVETWYSHLGTPLGNGGADWEWSKRYTVHYKVMLTSSRGQVVHPNVVRGFAWIFDLDFFDC